MTQQPHILVIRFSALGDVAMLAPVLRVFQQTYPNVQLSLLTRAKMGPIFNEFKSINILVFDPELHKGMRGLWSLFQSLRKQKVSAIADMHFVLRSRLLSLFFKGFGYRVKNLDKNRTDKRALTRSKGKKFSPIAAVHYAYADVFRQLGYPVDLSKHRFPDSPSKKGIFDIEGIPLDKKKWIGIAPFAAHPGKCYPLDLMQKVVAYLQQDHQVLLFGGGTHEKEQTERWEMAYKNVYSLVKKPLIVQLKIMPYLNVMLAMDSANGHLAANFGLPVVTLWGMTHPFLGFKPFLQPNENQIVLNREQYPKIPTSVYGNKIPVGYENAFRSLQPKLIIEKVLNVLEQNDN